MNKSKNKGGRSLCRNCKTLVSGAYCSSCGQKVDFDLEPSLHDFIHELVHEFLHLDGKIFRTLRVLVTQPGELTAELLRGRRNSYIGPIRLYLSISLVLFLLDGLYKPPTPEHVAKPGGAYVEEAESTSAVDRVLVLILPTKQKEKVAQFNKDHPDELQAFATKSNPKIFFILVPIFALLLQLSFLPQRKKYVPYLYFALHFHAAVFGIGCFLFIAAALENYLGAPVLSVAQFVWYMVSIIYLILAIRKVWGESLLRAILRTAFVTVSYVMCFFTTILIFTLAYVNFH